MTTVASEVLESTLVPLRESLETTHENFDVLHPDGEKSQILSRLTAYRQTMHPTLSHHYEEELAFLVLVGRAV